MYKPSVLFCCSLLASSMNLSAADEQPQDHPISYENVHASFESFTGLITGSKVRLRTQPSLEAHVVRETNQGEMFAVLGEVGDYYAVKPPKGVKGYIFRTFFLDGVIEGNRVNVRLLPDIEAPVVARLNTGDRIEAIPTQLNAKWLEIDLPENSRFFVAKEFIENIGGVELVSIFEKKKMEATHYLSAASLFAQSEMQKPFEQIDFDRIQASFASITKEFSDLPEIMEQIKDSTAQIQDHYVQKKIAFLEGKACGKNYQAPFDKSKSAKQDGMAHQMVSKVGTATGLNDSQMNDKMLAWLSLEESLYHMWAAANEEKSMDEFYEQEFEQATTLSGIIEPYTRPVKNRPGDFVLKIDNLPVAFLYSTRINLENLVGKKVTVTATPRPNHQFAFPAYFVLNIQ